MTNTSSLADDALEYAVAALRAGGIVAHPTESVYGLGCDPANEAAVHRLLQLKQRSPAQGVLLIGAEFEQLEAFIDLASLPSDALQRVRASWPGPHTWVLPRAANAPAWIVGAQQGIALRQTAHAPAAELCRRFGAAIVSTSANLHGQPPARSLAELDAAFGQSLDAIAPGAPGELPTPTSIRNALTGAIIRT